MNLLLTSIGRRVELLLALKDAANRLKIDLKLHGSDITSTAPALAFCDKIHMTCRISDPDYIQQLLKICQENQIDLLIPTIDTDLLILAQNKALFEQIGTRVLISAPDKIKLCRDKRYTMEFFEECSLKTPKTVDSVENYHGGFPCFIKPKDGSSSINAFKADSYEELLGYVEEVPDYIIQPFIDGIEYTIDIFCDFDGNPIFITPRERVLVRGGEVIKTKIVWDQKMDAEAKAIIEHFKPCGPITVQLIREKYTGEDYFIEINPRFGGGAPLSMKAGADSAEALLRLMMGESISEQRAVAKADLVFSRFDDSICSGGNEPVQIKAITQCLDELKGKDATEAVIFDLDDTLYDEKDYVRSGFLATAEKYSQLCGAQIVDVVKALNAAFQNGEKPIDELLDESGMSENKKKTVKSELLQAYRHHFPDICLSDDVKQLLQDLSEKGIKIGIITDGRPEGQRLKLKALGLLEDPSVSEIIITDELAGKCGNPLSFRKPNQIAFQLMKERLGIPYRKIAYVGDNMDKDFIAPQRLGMKCIHYDNINGLYYKPIVRGGVIEPDYIMVYSSFAQEKRAA